ncbi:anti-sigma factor family protein [Bosea rubneri]|uniref:Anti-sigma factor n=1 Tax=Bosea rubneri TaxID=3075434 RepID=A0ABU3SDU6_9HYPH|nr:hypothetical protein [Bosea sp. ZW T0_25]MDU0342963.1 hypothetical protein [Bosea sp. ZW T0_25]
MTKPEVSDEMLIALADGELSAGEAERLHALVTADPELAERFAILAETRFLLEAEGEPKPEAVPERLLAAIAAADARPAPVQPQLTVIAGGRWRRASSWWRAASPAISPDAGDKERPASRSLVSTGLR